MKRTLLQVLRTEQEQKRKGGIYHKLQVDFAYNSNHIEGSKLSHEQTQYIYDTKTVGLESAKVDDIIETVNHFRCFDQWYPVMSELGFQDTRRTRMNFLGESEFWNKAQIEELIGIEL